MKRAAALASLVAACGILPQRARANALDTFGFSARGEALAGALCADARGYTGAHYNPAGVALTADREAAASYSYGFMGLQLNGRDAQVATPRGVSLGLALPLKIRSWTAAFGLALYIPDQYVARIQLVPSTEPHYVLLDNNLQHIVVTPVIALRPSRYVSIGAGLTLLADAAGNGVTFDVGVVGGDKVGKATLDVALPTRVAPVIGLELLPLPWLRFGAAWRGEVDLGLRLDILANVNIVGAITGDTLISLRAVNFYTPHKVSLGATVDLGGLQLHAQVDWLGWSFFTGAIPDQRVLVNLSISPPLVEALFPHARFDDVWVPRVGAEWNRVLHPKVMVTARAGYAYERSPVPQQTGLTSFADNDRHVVALGGGVALRGLTSILPKPIRFDVALQLHALVPRTTTKDLSLYPGSGFSSGGYIVHFAAGLEVKF